MAARKVTTKAATRGKTTKRTAPTIAETHLADSNDLVPGVVDDDFCEWLARKCESQLSTWLRENAPGHILDLYDCAQLLRGYAVASVMHDGRVSEIDNREIPELIITAANAIGVVISNTGSTWDKSVA